MNCQVSNLIIVIFILVVILAAMGCGFHRCVRAVCLCEISVELA